MADESPPPSPVVRSPSPPPSPVVRSPSPSPSPLVRSPIVRSPEVRSPSPPPSPSPSPSPTLSPTLPLIPLTQYCNSAREQLREKFNNLTLLYKAADKENGGVERRERKKGSGSGNSRYPEREGVEECRYYMKTGLCKFGTNCKFNHPPFLFPSSHSQGDKGKWNVNYGSVKDGSVEREGRIDCKYFDRPGGCKFGKGCKFNHSRKASPTLELNFMGLPIRLGEKECPYYMHNGTCKFGATCRFNHPDPTSLRNPDALHSHSNGTSSPSVSQSPLAPWSPRTAANDSPAYVLSSFLRTQVFSSQPDWNAYQAPLYPPEGSLSSVPMHALNCQSSERNNYYAIQQEQKCVDEFPERPGQPECSYFIKTGDCKYRSACKFHHPKMTSSRTPSCSLSELGLPLRPGESICSHYSRYGICKYGPACKYDHPIHLADSPVVSSLDGPPGLHYDVVQNQALAAGS